MSDPQRNRLYAAEVTFGPAHRTAIDRVTIREIMDEVCQLYRLPRPGLKYIKKPKSWMGAYMQTEHGGANAVLVVNSAHAFDIPMLLHEMAHLIDTSCFSDDHVDFHGPRFCGIAAWLYDHFKVLPSYAYYEILKRHKVRFWTASRCSPKRIKKRPA